MITEFNMKICIEGTPEINNEGVADELIKLLKGKHISTDYVTHEIMDVEISAKVSND